MARNKHVYLFGTAKTEGDASMRNLLGGKGANLAEMSRLKLPVPAGFTITTEVCTYYYEHESTYPAALKTQVRNAVRAVEKKMGTRFGDPANPLLLSVRSGARASMPGMMETILNIGLTSKTIPFMIEASGNEGFVYDSYRRLIMMYADVVMEKALGLNRSSCSIRELMEKELESVKKAKGYKSDSNTVSYTHLTLPTIA